ncbi:DNA cytosine methyltransferase [Saccharibacillus brassicae]|uniref:DNA (cytosine-5-)-methyltransferase n=1 Tax=Saccharibacillus brassicae TaxID=2583377 RepID=A0A4Y6V0F3_SACBS|nr:DNA cytosine methyltransferase [Saccharibacillus brassicae]QDH23483.1 DNA cytosine methyltransferase [Saccharibacillus brassicae]
MQEIIVDNFAGGGGASTGIELATGRSVDVAINHDPAAIAMHRANHPETDHYCESVWDVDPRDAAGGRPVGLVWLSPDCKHFSKAKGGKPVEKAIRGLAWVAVRWAATVKPRVIMLENVEEFKTWGPLLENGYPDPKQKGRTFNSFINALRRQGYEVETRELRACDYGAPTIRKRLFLVARRDGRPIVWPEPTHSAPNSPEVLRGERKPWRTAAEIIDWSIPCKSIFGRKKELAENTLRRIARGIDRFVVNNPRPFVIKVNHKYDQFRGQEIDQPFQTITAKNGWGIVTPYIARIGQTGFGGDRLQYELDDPLTTITTKAKHLLIVPHVTKFRGGAVGHAVDEPLHTVTSGAGAARPAGAAHAIGIVSAFLTQYHTETKDNAPRGQTLDRPILTLDASNRYGLVTAHVARHFGESVGSPADTPLGTVTAGGGGKSAVVTSHLVKLRGTCADGQPVTEPMPTITAGGTHVGEVRAFLLKYYGSADNGQTVDEPLHTVTTKDRFGLVTIEGIDYQIVDIGMRMLEPHELFAAQGFPETYTIDVDADGKKYSKSAQVARCGNAVPPPFAKALVQANLPEMCVGAGNALALERYKPAAGQVAWSL